MPNHSSISSEPLRNVKKLILWKQLSNNFNIEKNFKKILKSVELSLMKFFHTVWNTSWELNMKVMKTLEMKVKTNKKEMKIQNKKELKTKNQNQKEKMQKLLELLSQNKNLNVKTNEGYLMKKMY